MAHSSASSNSNFVIAHDLRRDRVRKENKCILATCGIWKDFHLHGGKFVGTGSLVQGLFLKFEEKIHLVTSNKVISPNDYLSCYYLYFKKSEDEEKERVKLDKMASKEVIFKSGLAIVLIDPKKLGFIRQYTSGFVNHRPFTILFKVKEDLRNDELYCHVAEESGKSMIAIRPYEVKGIADEETYVTDHSSIKIESTSFCSSHRKGLGAPIAITVKDEAVAVGAITLSNNQQLSFVLFSQIDRKRAFSDEGNGGGGEQQAPGEPAEGEEQRPPREPAGGEEQQAPGEPVGGEEQQAPRESAGGEEQQAPREPAGGEEQQAPGEPAGGEEQQAPREPAGGEEQQAPGEPAGGEEQQAPGEPAGGEEQQALGEPAGGEEQQAPGEQDGQNLNIGVGVAHMAPSDPNAYSTTVTEVLCLIVRNYFDYTPPRNREERDEFEKHLEKVGTLITGVKLGSLVITVKCDSLKSLEELWKMYSCGHLGKMVQDCFVTEKILKELNLAELKLKTTMDLEEYNAYKLYFLEKDALKGASSSEFHSISSTSESPQKQEELKKWEQKTKIVETEKRKGMLPLFGSSTSDPKEELEELRMKLQIMKGASSSEFHSISSPSESPQNQEELKKWKQKTKIDEKGTSPLTVIPTTGHGKELIGKAQGRKVTSWIVTTLFEATIDLLINKDRDKAAEILKDGDVTGQRFRSLIVRELDDIKSKLDVFLRRDLQASFSFFEEGIALLYEVFDIVESRNELGAATTQVARDDTFSLVEGIRRLELTGLDESVTRKLYTAKERFKDARREATRAFKNEGLKTSDRILAMKCRVMATILEKVDNPSDALAPCGVCVKELNSLSAVQNSFDVQFKTGIQKVRGLFGKEERREIIFNVCHVNRVIFDFALALGRLDFNLSVDIGENKVIPLCDARVKDLADRHGKEYCCVPLKPFGQRGKEEHKLKHPMAIATNSSGEFIITDLHHVKVFDNSGNFVKQSSLSTDEANRTFAFEVATDMSDNIFVLIELEKPRSELSYWVYKLTKTADLHHAFRLRGEGKYRGLSVSDKGKVVTLRGANTVEEYDTDGEFVRSFGLGIISSARDIIVANDGLVMVLGDYYVHIFSESGDYLDKFKLQQRDCDYTCITFHRAGEQVVAAGILARNLLQVEIYSKDGEFVYCAEIAIDGWFRNLRKITLTTKGRIACVADGKVFIF